MGMEMGHFDDLTLTWIGSMGSIANGLSRIFWGPLQDLIGFKRIYAIVLSSELIVCVTITGAVQTSATLYSMIVILGFLCLGAHFVMFPGVVLKVYGLRAGS
jgi:MFS family permease